MISTRVQGLFPKHAIVTLRGSSSCKEARMRNKLGCTTAFGEQESVVLLSSELKQIWTTKSFKNQECDSFLYHVVPKVALTF